MRRYLIPVDDGHKSWPAGRIECSDPVNSRSVSDFWVLIGRPIPSSAVRKALSIDRKFPICEMRNQRGKPSMGAPKSCMPAIDSVAIKFNKTHDDNSTVTRIFSDAGFCLLTDPRKTLTPKRCFGQTATLHQLGNPNECASRE